MQDLAVVQPREMQEWTREKVDLLKRTVARGATDDELALFAHVCKRTGLDPFARQIYAIKRWNSQDNKETMALQTGIDGYRLIADRTGCYAGSSDPEYVVADDGFPDVAKVTVTKLVNGVACAFTSSARWDEYVQKGKDGSPTAMWKRMPFLMLGKCAEALALRKAFPAELSGLYTHEEMQQADEPKAAFIDNKNMARTKIGEIQIEGIKTVEQDDAKSQQDANTLTQQASDAAPSEQDEIEMQINEYGQLFRNANTLDECNKLYREAPEHFKKHIHPAYNQALQLLNKNKKR